MTWFYGFICRPCWEMGLICSMLSTETREMWKNRWFFFFKLSLSGLKVWAQSDSVQIDQPWSKTVHGQECCKFFSFVRIKVFHGKGLGFWGFFFLTGIVKWIFLFLALVEQFTALKLSCWVFSCSPCCRTGQKFWSLLSPHAFVPCPDPMSSPWSPLQLHFLKVPAGEGADAPAWTKTGHPSWRAAGPSPALGEEAPAKSNIPKSPARFFFAKNTARASAGLSWAEEKPWTLAGIRWVVWSTFTGERRLKEQNPRAEQTSHCPLPVQGTWV